MLVDFHVHGMPYHAQDYVTFTLFNARTYLCLDVFPKYIYDMHYPMLQVSKW